MKKMACRVTMGTLADVCNDCYEFLKEACIECEDCPVKILSDKQKRK